MPQILLSTQRLRLRKLQLSDLPAFHAYRSNPEVTKYQGFDVYSFEEAREFIQSQTDQELGASGQWVQYGVEETETQTLIGDCAIGLDKDDIRIAEIGMTLSPNHQGKGFAKEALLGLLKYLFEKRQIHRVVEIMDAKNEAAIHLVESLGFRKEGHFVENIFFKGSWGSEYQYAMLRREWEGLLQS